MEKYRQSFKVYYTKKYVSLSSEWGTKKQRFRKRVGMGKGNKKNTKEEKEEEARRLEEEESKRVTDKIIKDVVASSTNTTLVTFFNSDVFTQGFT